MKYVIILLSGILFFSCRGSRSVGYSDQKDLNSLIKRLDKRGDDPVVLQDIRSVYDNARFKALVRLQNYSIESAPGKWDKIVPELQSLQQMHNIILKNSYAYRNVKPANYNAWLLSARDSAAADYYAYAEQISGNQSRSNKRRMYDAYAQALTFVPDYLDARNRMTELYQSSILQVLINPVQFDFIGWGLNSLPLINRRMDDLHARLIQDLGGQSARSVPARFYNPFQLRQDGIRPDLVADMIWRNVQIDQPGTSGRNYNRSKQIETGRDTANRPLYTTVYATVYINEQSLQARGSLHLLINDVSTRNQIVWDQYPAEYSYVYETATYTGDRRALTDRDWTLINRNRYQQLPNRGEIYAEMFERVFNNIQNRIQRTASW